MSTNFWPIQGYIILKRFTPVAVFDSSGNAYEYTEFLSKKYPGVPITTLYADGNHTQTTKANDTGGTE